MLHRKYGKPTHSHSYFQQLKRVVKNWDYIVRMVLKEGCMFIFNRTSSWEFFNVIAAVIFFKYIQSSLCCEFDKNCLLAEYVGHKQPLVQRFSTCGTWYFSKKNIVSCKAILGLLFARWYSKGLLFSGFKHS